MDEDRKKLTIEIPESIYRSLRMVVSARDCTMRDYILHHIGTHLDRDLRLIKGGSYGDDSGCSVCSHKSGHDG